MEEDRSLTGRAVARNQNINNKNASKTVINNIAIKYGLKAVIAK